jgi:hypothetical protein
MEPKLLYCLTCEEKTEHTKVNDGWMCLCGKTRKTGCDHDGTVTVVQRWHPGTRYDPPEVEEQAYCTQCGEYGDVTDFPDAAEWKTVDADDVRRRLW